MDLVVSMCGPPSIRQQIRLFREEHYHGPWQASSTLRGNPPAGPSLERIRGMGKEGGLKDEAPFRGPWSLQSLRSFGSLLFLEPPPQRHERLAVPPRRDPPQPLVVADLGREAARAQGGDQRHSCLEQAGVVEVVGGAAAEAVVGLARGVVAEAPHVVERALG